MNILVVGQNGYLGSYLTENLPCQGVSVRSPEDLRNIPQPDLVINCAGVSSLEACEAAPELSRRANLELVQWLCGAFRGATLVHFSSYYVYDAPGACAESAPTTDRYAYTAHKLASERCVLDNGGSVFRLGKLFGHPDVSRQLKLTEALIAGHVTQVDRSAFNPTSLPAVLHTIQAVITRDIAPGLYNLSNSGFTTHATYATEVYSALHRPFTLTICEQITRSFHNYGRFLMSTNNLARSVHLNPWQVDLHRYIELLRSAEPCTASATSSIS